MIKNILLTIVFVLCVYVVFGGYIAAMFNGKLPMQKVTQSAERCAVFQDGTQYRAGHVNSIDKYHAKTGQSFDYFECLR